MDNSSTTTLDQADEEILTPTESDKALEAAAGGTERGPFSTFTGDSRWMTAPCCF
jgi:hypothetical protein